MNYLRHIFITVDIKNGPKKHKRARIELFCDPSFEGKISLNDTF